MRRSILSSIIPLLSLASAGAVPRPPGLKVIWSDDFTGAAGALPDSSKWNLVTGIHTNNEVQDYTRSNQNVQLSGGDTVQFVPRRDAKGKWTSARIETKEYFTPAPGKTMTVEAAIRFGDHQLANKQGIWPAFWMLGEAIHKGTDWPMCGEIDIMETVNGLLTGYGTVHCGSNPKPGGPCNEPIGRPGTVTIPDNGWHTWSLTIDREGKASWQDEVIRWAFDGGVYHTLSGAQLGEQAVWSTLAHSPLFAILNVAVGGNWPGNPNAATLDAWGSMMEVDYVAVYST